MNYSYKPTLKLCKKESPAMKNRTGSNPFPAPELPAMLRDKLPGFDAKKKPGECQVSV